MPDMIKWIDLRDPMYPVRLKVGLQTGEDNRQRTILFIMGLRPGTPRWENAIDRLGFRPSATAKYLLRVRAEDEPRTITPAMFHPVWPNAQTASMDRRDVVLDLNAARRQRITEEPRTEDETRAAVETGAVRRLGRNAQGDEVFVGAAGRYVVNANGLRTVEGRLARPEMFLRAPDEDALDRCADGFVQSLLHGDVQHSEHLDAFMLAVLDREGPYAAEEYGRIQAVVDAAMVRFLHESYETAVDAYGDARTLFDNLPNYRGPRRGEAAMPLPLSVIAQRLLGDTAGKRVSVPQPWDGASFAFLPPGTQILAAGHESRLSRHAARIRTADAMWMEPGSPGLFQDLDGLFFNADPEYGIDGSREDLVRALAALRGLKAGARAVLVLAAGSPTGEVTPQERNVFQAIARRYDVETAIQLPEALTRKLATGSCLRLISLSARPPRATSLRLDSFKTVAGWDALKSEVDEIIATAEVREAESERIDIERAAQVNQFQRPYVAFSKVSEPRTMVPANLQEPLQAALAAVEHVYGPVDGFVERSLGFGPNTLGRRFSSEQVDALALMLHRGMQGRGMIIGDETGVGKGRTLAGAAVFANKTGCPVVFITDRANLFSDFVRDLRDIEEWGRFRPLITNADGTIMDVFTNEVLVDKPNPRVLAQAIEEGKKPADLGVNLIFTTYSQISGEESPKADWLREIMPQCMLVVDEAHIAAGSDSNISRAIVDLTTSARFVVYSSATWAKSSENLHVYARALPESINVSSLAQTMRQGGEAFSEMFSSMLARDGAFIRREHDLSRVEFVVEIDEENRARNEQLSDKVSEVLAAMTFVGGEINKLLARANDETVKILKRARAARVGDEGGAGERRRGAAAAAEGRIFRSGFGAGSVLYQVMRRSLAVMNADNVARSAIRAVSENRKPVIVFDETGEAFVRAILKAEMVPGLDGERATLPDFVHAPTVKDLLRNVLKRLGAVTFEVVTDNDVAGAERAARRATAGAQAEAVENEEIDIDAVLEQDDQARRGERVVQIENIPGMTPEKAEDYRKGIERILEMIEQLPALPLNAVDVVQARLAAAGIQFGEISGRQFRLAAPVELGNEAVDSPAWSERKWAVAKRDKKKRTVTETAYRFNNGDVDAVFINRSAATGISLHASARFSDTRQREIVELQTPEDPTNRIQLYGRVNRFDQVITPVIRMCTTGIYGEVRALMMQNKKLARLSANVRSSRDNAAEFRSIPDLLNSVGRDVSHRYLLDNGGVRSRLGITEGDLERPGFDAAARLTSRVALLRVAEQRSVYEEVTEIYNDEIARYEMEGANPLKPREFDWRCEQVEREIVTGVDMEGLGSTFDGPVYLTKVRWETELRPITAQQAFAMAANNARKLLDAGMGRPSSDLEYGAQRIAWRREISVEAAMTELAHGNGPGTERGDREAGHADERDAAVEVELEAEDAVIAEDGQPPQQDELGLDVEDSQGLDAAEAEYPAVMALPQMGEDLAVIARQGGMPELQDVVDSSLDTGASPAFDLAQGYAAIEEAAPRQVYFSTVGPALLASARQVPLVALEPLARKLARLLEAKMIAELPGTQFADVAAALADPNKNGVKRLDAQRRWILERLPYMAPGAILEKPGKESRGFGALDFEDSSRYLVLDVIAPPSGKEHNLSRWKLDLMAPGDEKPVAVSLATMMDGVDLRESLLHPGTTYVDGGWYTKAHIHNADPALERVVGDRRRGSWQDRSALRDDSLAVERMYARFYWMRTGYRTMNAYLMDGNMYMAADWAAAAKMGSGVMYTDAAGLRHRGVMLNKSVLNREGDLERNLPVRLWSPEMIGEFFTALWRGYIRHAANRPAGAAAGAAEVIDDDSLAVFEETERTVNLEALATQVPDDGNDAAQPQEQLTPVQRRQREREAIKARWVPTNGPAETYFFNTDLKVALKGTSAVRAANEKGKPVVALRAADCLMLSVPKVDAHRIDRALKAEAKRAFMAAHPNSRSYSPEQLAEARSHFLWPELRGGGGGKKGSGKGAKGMAAVRIGVANEEQLKRAAAMIARAAGIELYVERGSPLGLVAQAVQEEYFEVRKEEIRSRLEAIRAEVLRQQQETLAAPQPRGERETAPGPVESEADSEEERPLAPTV